MIITLPTLVARVVIDSQKLLEISTLCLKFTQMRRENRNESGGNVWMRMRNERDKTLLSGDTGDYAPRHCQNGIVAGQRRQDSRHCPSGIVAG